MNSECEVQAIENDMQEFVSNEPLRIFKDRSASKTPLWMRKNKRRAQNKIARASRKLNRK